MEVVAAEGVDGADSGQGLGNQASERAFPRSADAGRLAAEACITGGDAEDERRSDSSDQTERCSTSSSGGTEATCRKYSGNRPQIENARAA